MSYLGDIYTRHLKRYQQAEELYMQVINSGNASDELLNDTKTSLGYLYMEENKAKEAFSLWSQAACSGQPMAEYGLGCLYQDGLGVDKNLEIALLWFQKSFAHGMAEAEKGIQYAQSELNRIKGQSNSQGKAGGCYIATAVYGSYDCPEVWVLRRYRDFVLAKSGPGCVFIRFYYALSPVLVK